MTSKVFWLCLQAAAENLELREQVKGVPSGGKASAAANTYRPLQPQGALSDNTQQIMPQTQHAREHEPNYPP